MALSYDGHDPDRGDSEGQLSRPSKTPSKQPHADTLERRNYERLAAHGEHLCERLDHNEANVDDTQILLEGTRSTVGRIATQTESIVTILRQHL